MPFWHFFSLVSFHFCCCFCWSGRCNILFFSLTSLDFSVLCMVENDGHRHKNWLSKSLWINSQSELYWSHFFNLIHFGESLYYFTQNKLQIRIIRKTFFFQNFDSPNFSRKKKEIQRIGDSSIIVLLDIVNARNRCKLKKNPSWWLEFIWERKNENKKV